MDGTMPKLTVVTVVFNSGQSLEKTIQSVLQQDYPRLEYIIIDGGSTDGTLDIVARYADRIAYWVSERDEGIYDAMNKGIDAATGDLICFMNAGDTFYAPETVSGMIVHNTPDVDVLYGDRVLVGPEHETYEKAQPLESFYRQMPFGHQSAFVRTHLMQHYHYSTEYRLSSDYDLLLKLYHRKYTFKYTDMPVCRFPLDGRSSTDKILSSYEALKVLEKYVGEPAMLEQSFFMQNLADSYNARRSRETGLMLFRTNAALFTRYFQAVEALIHRPLRYVIYGYAEIGKGLYALMPEKVVAFLDIKSDRRGREIIPGAVYHPENIRYMEFDKIIITVLGREAEIMTYLTDVLDVEQHKIIVLDI